jgi:predicted NBD/HSP70 family sugar kinase/thiol-disulfide isomerase/thioredoxin
MLRGRRGHEDIYFENIAAPSFDPAANKGISKEEAMGTIHVISNKDGSITKGMEALEMLYAAVGLGWVFQLARLPLFGPAAELIYKFISKNRMSIGGGMDAVMALGKINMEAKGEGSCAEDGECRDTYKDEPAPAAAAAVASASATVDGAAAPAAAADGAAAHGAPAAAADGKPAALRGSALDRDHILGIYYSARRGDEGAFLRAAPVDVSTGELLAAEAVHPLSSTDVESVIEGTKALCAALEWDGVLGVGLPGLLRHAHEVSPSDRGGANASLISMSALARRHARMATEAEMQEATEREVLVMTGAEANGYGEMLYGAGVGEKGLVMMVTMGRGLGVALFDRGVLVRNVETSEHTWTWGLPMWRDAPLPSADEPPGAPAWTRWAERAESYLSRLDAVFNPELIIVGGAAGESAAAWLPLVTAADSVKAPLRPAALGSAAGILGSAAGGKLQIALRDDLARVRAAIGRSQGVSPQLLKRDALRKVFDSFDTDLSGLITPDELAAAVRALGVSLPEDELRELVIDLDADGTGEISFEEFYTWWTDLVASSPVTYLHTEAEFDGVLEEEGTSGRLVVLEVGFTFCRPCKKFEPLYKQFATRFPDARFLRINGNENTEMVHIGRDRLGVKSSPSFYFFRNGEEVHRHSGAKAEKFEESILKFCKDRTPPPLP